MKIVIDSNRAIAAMIKESTTREILLDKTFEFFAPEYIKEEIEKYEEEIMQKASLEKEEFAILLSLIFEHITIIPQGEYHYFVEELKNKISDLKDVAYLAVCLSIKADGIWTHDLHFQEQKRCRIYTNVDLLRLRGKAELDSDKK